MKAYVLHGVNDLKLEEVLKPQPKTDEALIAVKAVGICGSDIPRIYETGAHNHPLIPGHEFSGVVESVGSNKHEQWIGKRVGIFPLIPCYECDSCKNQHYELCRHYSYLGSRKNGAFAEYVTVPVKNLIELPDNVSFEVAAMLEPMSVAIHAIRLNKIDKSNIITICGLGTVGTLIMAFLKSNGFDNLLLIGNKDIQHKNTKIIGIDDRNFCDIRKQDADDWIMEHTNGKGVNVFFECVGKNETINHSIKCTAPLGNVILIGNPYSDVNFDKNIYWKILRHQLKISGSWNSSFTYDNDDDWHAALNLLEKSIDMSFMISHRLPLQKLEQGLNIMRDKSEEYCKIIIQP